VHNSWYKSQPPDDQSASAVCLSVIQHVRAKISPMTRMPYPGVDSGNVALSAIVISSGTSQPARRRHSRAGGCGPRDESRRRESAFSRFAGVGQVGRFALDPPPISCSPPLAPATVRRSTVNTCTRSRLPTRISRQRQLILYVLLMYKHRISRTANSFWRSYLRLNCARAGPHEVSIRDHSI